MSARENILQAIVTLINGAGGASVYRSREEPVTRQEGAVIVVRPEEEQVDLVGMGHSKRMLTVVFEVTLRGAIPDQLADPILVALHSALMADTTLGGLCALVQEIGTKYDFEMADQQALVAEVRYVVTYGTPARSLALS